MTSSKAEEIVSLLWIIIAVLCFANGYTYAAIGACGAAAISTVLSINYARKERTKL